MTIPIKDGAELSSHWYEEIKAEGEYEMARVKQEGGMGIIAFLKMNSDTGPVYVDLFDRSEDEAKQFEGQRVEVSGQIQPPLDEDRPLHIAVRDDLPALVSISSIVLAKN